MLFVFLVFWRPQDWLITALEGWPMLDAIVVLALGSLFVEVKENRLRLPKASPQLYLLGGLWFAAIMSHVAHTYFGGVLDTIPIVFKVCFFSALLVCVLDRPSRLRGIARVIVAMACVMAVHAILQERTGRGFIGQRPLFIRGYGDAPSYTRSLFFGIFHDPNDLAQILATAIPFSFAIFRRRSIISFLVAGGISWLLVAAILVTHSRGGLVALVAVSGVMFVLMLPTRWLPAALTILVIAGLVLCPLSGPYMDDSAHDRVIFWGEANEVFKRNLVFGVGYGMFMESIEEERASHNAFVLCYTELGFFGYWFWYNLLQVGIVGAWRARTACSRPQTLDQAWLKRFSGLTVAAVAGFVASAYFLSRTFVHPLFFLFAILAALPLVATRILPDDQAVVLDMRKDVLVMGSIGAGVSIIYIYFTIVLLNKAWFGG